MNEKQLKRILTIVMFIGLILVLLAIALAVFARLHILLGAKGVVIITVTAALGLLMLLPSKIFLTLMLMKKNND